MNEAHEIFGLGNITGDKFDRKKGPKTTSVKKQHQWCVTWCKRPKVYKWGEDYTSPAAEYCKFLCLSINVLFLEGIE